MCLCSVWCAELASRVCLLHLFERVSPRQTRAHRIVLCSLLLRAQSFFGITCEEKDIESVADLMGINDSGVLSLRGFLSHNSCSTGFLLALVALSTLAFPCALFVCLP